MRPSLSALRPGKPFVDILRRRKGIIGQVFLDELKEMLEKAEIEYDPQYLD